MFGWFKKAKTIVTEELPAVTQMIVDLIKSEPDQWKADRHYFKHNAGMSIWIANDAWAIHVDMPGRGQIIKESSNCTPTASHKAIWEAYKWWQVNGNITAMHQYVQKANELKFARSVAFLNELVDKDIREIESRHGIKHSHRPSGIPTLELQKEALIKAGYSTKGLSWTEIEQVYWSHENGIRLASSYTSCEM